MSKATTFDYWKVNNHVYVKTLEALKGTFKSTVRQEIKDKIERLNKEMLDALSDTE